MAQSTIPGKKSVSLGQLVTHILRHKVLMAVLLLFPVGLAFAYIVLATPRWEAVALVSVGQLGTLSGTKPIEPTARSMERLKSRALQDKVVAALGAQAPLSAEDASAYRGSLKARLVGTAEIVEFRVQGASAELARRLADATIKELQREHENLIKPSRLALEEHVANALREINRIKVEQDLLSKRFDDVKGANASNPATALLAFTLATLESERRLQERARISYEEALRVQSTATMSMGEPSVSDGPVRPKSLYALAFAIVIGGLLVTTAAYLLASVNGDARID